MSGLEAFGQSPDVGRIDAFGRHDVPERQPLVVPETITEKAHTQADFEILAARQGRASSADQKGKSRGVV